jgi:hypothetical protein
MLGGLNWAISRPKSKELSAFPKSYPLRNRAVGGEITPDASWRKRLYVLKNNHQFFGGDHVKRLNSVKIVLTVIALASFIRLGTVVAQTINDLIPGNSTITFSYTVNGTNVNGLWWRTSRDNGSTWTTPAYNPGGFYVPNPGGQSELFQFWPPSSFKPTDWTQTVTYANGKSDVSGVNLTDPGGDAWSFQPLDQLPNVNWAIPDLAPASGGDSNLTIYAAVNLSIYLQDNPLGPNGGNYSMGQTLDQLGLSISNGVMAGLQGIWWSTTPFTIDTNSVTGFDTDGLLNSATFGDTTPIEILAIHTPEPSTFALLGFGILSLLGYEWRRRKAKA